MVLKKKILRGNIEFLFLYKIALHELRLLNAVNSKYSKKYDSKQKWHLILVTAQNFIQNEKFEKKIFSNTNQLINQ